MKYIYQVNECSKYENNNGEVDFCTWTTFKAFRTKEKAEEYAKALISYNDRHQINGIKRDVYVKEVEMEEE